MDEEAIANYCMMYSEFLVPDNYLVRKDNILYSTLKEIHKQKVTQVSKSGAKNL